MPLPERTCQALGINYVGQDERIKRQVDQAKKFNRKTWATVREIRTVAKDGKTRDMVAITRKTFAMWLATIDAGRLEDHAIRRKVATERGRGLS